MAGILSSVLGTTPKKYTMTKTGSRIIRNLHGLPGRNHGIGTRQDYTVKGRLRKKWVR